MSTAPDTEIILGCDPTVRLVIQEDDGNLALRIYAEDPENTDLDALFFNMTDDTVITNLNYYPAFDENIGSNGENITGIDMQAGTQNQLNNGAQIQEQYDVKLEFGTIPYTSSGDVDEATFTIWVEGETPLTADSIDLTNLTAVVNTDNGGGLALTGGINGGQTNTEVVMVTETAISEDFEGGVSDAIDTGEWNVTRNGELMTNSRNEGEIALDAVESDGPVTFSFDARTNDSDRFENSGNAADELVVQVRIDDGEWITLDTFQVNDEGTALVGDQTGQTFGDDGSTLSYSGGALDAGGNVEFRMVSDITARDEKIFIDDIEVTVTDEVEVEGGSEETTLGDDILVNGALDSSVEAGRWTYNGDVDGWQNVNAGPGIEAWGDGFLGMDAADGDSFIELDSTNGDVLDSVYQDVQTEEGQTYQLDLSAAQRGDDNESIEIYWNGELVETITPEGDFDWNEYTFEVEGTGGLDRLEFRELESENDCMGPLLDAVSLRPIEVVEDEEDEHACEDFEDAEAGDVVFDQFDGFTVTAQRAGDAADSENDAMIFDTANPTGGDRDLGFEDQGNAIIISEDNDSDDPDDNARGGTISFEFDEISDVSSVTLLDIEGTGTTIDLYDADGELINTIPVVGTGDNTAQDIEINATGVAFMDVNLHTSGAVDDVCFAPTDSDESHCPVTGGGQYEVMYDDLMLPPKTEEELAALEEQQNQQDTTDDLVMM